MSEDRLKRQKRRQSHIAKDLRTPKYHQRVRQTKLEDDAERRYRKYKDVREIGLTESGELAEKLNEKFNEKLND